MNFKSWVWILALRHLSGKATRPAVRWMNLFAFAGLALSVFAWITVTSVMGGMQGQIKERILNEKPHLLWEGRPQQGSKEFLRAVKEELASEYEDAATYLRSEALVEMRRAHRNVQTGALLEGRDEIPSGQALAGSEIFSELGASTNDVVSVRSVWALEQFPLSLVLSGTFQSGVYELDRNVLRVSRGDLSQWLGLGEDAYSYFSAKLKDPNRAELMKERLVRRFPGLDFKTWQEADAALWYSLRLEKIVMSLAVFFVLLLSLFALYMAMSVRLAEKSREMALLRGLGAQNFDLQKLFLIEGGILSGLAALMGIGLSWFFCKLISGWLTLPDFYYSTSIPVDWSWDRVIFLALGVLLLGLLSTWWPVRRGFQFSVAETLRS
jgi:lipoprotein-releasing system permease protein